ncbi:protein phosphatase 1G-like [Myxocyprinus asiaticus]|uniref:protein phosphatase 1G-like n=1 Tax=Myxocyprinus asiaticus TaxID=70543 RepID=UPI002222CFD9|nr:protein phosphatase 1G-like [Myxocyprinus asiaticus]
MGAYLSQPNTEKSTADGGNKNMNYGFAAMQGWRVSMEDAHNCIPELDDETAMFAVYDGHGGEEVALYCSKYLPDIIKEQKTYKDGKLQKALEDAFLAIDGRITTEEVIKELVQIAGRPQEETEKVADEDDVDNEEAALLHEEATMTIEELLIRYGQNMNKSGKKTCQDATKESEDREKSCAETGINGKPECGASEADSNGKEKAGGAGSAAESSKVRACRRAAASSGGSGSASEGSAGDAGPSCSSSEAPAPGSAKSKFFEDSDESEEGEGEEEEGSDGENCSEDEDAENSSENDEEDDTEEGEEEDTDEEEEMCLPGMDGKEEPGSDSGTTAVVALIRGKQLIVANAGDSRCVVSEKGKAVDMSYDHKPEDELELARIKNAGGKVTMDGRVNGGLNLSRAIGDHFYKRNKALPPEEQMISALPDVKVLTLNEDHEFMVIACDGIWNVMSSQEVVDFVNERLKTDSGKNRPLSAIIEELLDHCLAPDTSGDGTGCDNMTCMIITFSPHLGSEMAEGTKKRKPDETVVEENGSDSKKAKTE